MTCKQSEDHSCSELELDFPQLSGTGYQITSPGARYTCVAYAMGHDDALWFPRDESPYYWPVEPRDGSPTGWVRAFLACGFEESPDGEFEDGFWKIALYKYNEDGQVSHVARQDVELHKWRSKCGDQHDIIHDLDSLEGPYQPEDAEGPRAYGAVWKFFRTSRQLPITGPLAER